MSFFQVLYFAIVDDLKRCNIKRLSELCGMRRQTIISIRDGSSNPRIETLIAIERAIKLLDGEKNV